MTKLANKPAKAPVPSSSEIKATVIELRNLVQALRKNIYRIAICCAKLLNNSGAYAAAVQIPEREVKSKLNESLVELNVDVDALLVLLDVFPDESAWVKPLGELYEDAAAVIAERDKTEAEPKERKPRTAASLKQVQELQDVNNALAEQVKRDNERIDELREQNEKLKAELAAAEKRIAHLEGQIAAMSQTRAA